MNFKTNNFFLTAVFYQNVTKFGKKIAHFILYVRLFILFFIKVYTSVIGHKSIKNVTLFRVFILKIQLMFQQNKFQTTFIKREFRFTNFFFENV